MEVIIKGKPKEIAALVLAAQERRGGEVDVKKLIAEINRAVRVKSNERIASLTDSLYTEIAVASITHVEWWKVEDLLANLVDEKRKTDESSQSRN